MGRGSPVCQQIREKIIEMFKNNVPQRKIGRDLDISPSTVHNIIKRFKESGGISVRKGQGRKPKLNNRDLRSLRRHCIKNSHSSISDITTWAQDYFGKPLSSTTIRSYIHKCQLKLYCAKRKPYVNSVQKRRRLLWARRHLGWTITRVGYRSHLNRYQYRYRYLEFGTGTQRYLFSVLYSLCNNINIYFSEKISPKLSISTF